MNKDTAHASHWAISETVFGVPLLVAIGLQQVFPLALPPGALRLAAIPLGIVLLGAGLAIVILARREFARYRQSMEPGRSISRIVDSGVFAISRNPLYLGIAAMLIGAALAWNALWILVMLLPAVVVCQIVLIGPEERYLENKFGAQYLAYASHVRRWLGRK